MKGSKKAHPPAEVSKTLAADVEILQFLFFPSKIVCFHDFLDFRDFRGAKINFLFSRFSRCFHGHERFFHGLFTHFHAHLSGMVFVIFVFRDFRESFVFMGYVLNDL